MPVDAAFKPSVSLEDRAALLKDVLPGLPQGKARDTLLALEPDRWTAVRAEASRVLQRLEELEIRDSDVGDVRNQVRDALGTGLTSAESGLAIELVTPFVVPNSSYDAQATNAQRDLAAAAVTPVSQSWTRDQVIVARGDAIDAVAFEAIQQFGLTTARPTSRASAAGCSSPRSSSACSSRGCSASGASSGTATTSCCSSRCSSCSACSRSS